MSLPNVLLVVLDSVRAQNCSLYGHENETTPFLESFADNAVVFEQARSPSIHSIASHASIFSGLHVEEHQITDHKDFLKPSATIWHYLNKQGYATGMFTPNVIVTITSNLAEPFDTCIGPKRTNSRLFSGGLAPTDIAGQLTTKEYIKKALNDNRPIRSIINGVYKKLSSRSGSHDPDSEQASTYVDEFLDWSDDQTGPWAACLNLMDAHTPYAPAQEYDKWSDGIAPGDHGRSGKQAIPPTFTDAYWKFLTSLEPLYDGAIRQADSGVEKLVSELRKRDALDDTLLVVTSDHGEGLGERSELNPETRLRYHSWGIDERLTHVPLVVSIPGTKKGRAVENGASLTQFPTVVRAALSEEDPVAAFIPDGPVLSSTYRIRPPGNELDLPQPEREPYLGPWRAVYQSEKEGVVKYARRGDDNAELYIEDAQTVIRRDDDDNGEVNRIFSKIRQADVRVGGADGRDINDDVEDRLADLGYLR